MTKRIGLLMKNLGHSAIYGEGHKRIPVTLLHLEDSFIVSLKDQSKCGYNAAVLGVGNFNSIKKPQVEILKKSNINNKCKLFESRLISIDGLILGSKLGIHFIENQFVDVTGYSIGKGFAGVMKRHNFKGMRASHGTSIAHRSQGSTGQCQDPGKVFKGKKMAGHLGDRRVTVQNLKVVYIDQERSLVVVKGNNVPGARGAYVFVKDAVKKDVPKNAPFPAVMDLISDNIV